MSLFSFRYFFIREIVDLERQRLDLLRVDDSPEEIATLKRDVDQLHRGFFHDGEDFVHSRFIFRLQIPEKFMMNFHIRWRAKVLYHCYSFTEEKALS